MMIGNLSSPEITRRAREALLVWGVFIALAIALNGTIPFILGVDLHAWSQSMAKEILFRLVLYAGLFLVVPLILIKGWETVRQPAFLLPMILAVLAITLGAIFRALTAISVMILIYLHRRFNLSDYGIRWRGWRGDLVAILLIGLLSSVPRLLSPEDLSFTPGEALLAGLDRLLANPASTVENLFYFGFIAERLSHKWGNGLTVVAVGLMYTAHEMTNPEYWYELMNFVLVFVGVVFFTVIYLWRRGVVAIWLGDGLGRFISRLV